MRASAAELVEGLGRGRDLPALQPVVLLTLRLLQSPRSDNAEVARLLGHDQALTARVLRLANSAFYATRERIHSPEHAVVLLGKNTLRSLILRATIFSGADQADERRFWLHALGTACAARAVATCCRCGKPEELFIAGLLHDLGKLVLARSEPALHADLRRRALGEQRLLFDLEREVLGFDHAEIGGLLCQRWSLPQTIAAAIHRHHAMTTPDRPTPAAAAVHLADILARALLVGSGGDRSIPALAPIALDLLGCTPQSFPELCERTEDELTNAEVFFNILEG